MATDIPYYNLTIPYAIGDKQFRVLVESDGEYFDPYEVLEDGPIVATLTFDFWCKLFPGHENAIYERAQDALERAKFLERNASDA